MDRYDQDERNDADQIQLPDRLEDPTMYDLLYGLKRLLEERCKYREAKTQYRGLLDIQTGSLKLDQILRKSADRHLFNMSSVPVKTMAHRLKIATIKVGDESAQKAWEEIWDANNLDGWIPKNHKETCKLGDNYMMTWPTYDEVESQDDDVEASGVQIYFLSPFNAIKVYDPDNPTIELYDFRYWEEDKYKRVDLIYRDEIIHYRTIQKEGKGYDSKDWELFTPSYTIIMDGKPVEIEGEPIEVNPFGELPMKHFRTDLPYGEPINKDGYGAANAISELLVAQIATITAQGWPARFALEEADATLNNGPQGIGYEDDEEAEAGDIRDRRIKSNPGDLTVLRNIKELVQLLPADPSVFTDPVELYTSLMSTLTETPFYSFKPGGEQPSGKAREIADAPIKANEQYLKLLLTSTYKEMVRLALRMVGRDVKPEDIEVEWAPTVLATDKDDWSTIKEKIEAGVPFEDVMTEAGYDSEKVTEWSEKLQEFGTEKRIEIMKDIVSIMGQLGSGTKAGILEREDANMIIAELMKNLGVTIGPPPEEDPAVDLVNAKAGAMGAVPPGSTPGKKPPGGVPSARPKPPGASPGANAQTKSNKGGEKK